MPVCLLDFPDRAYRLADKTHDGERFRDVMDQLFRDACRRCVQEVNPKLDETSFVKIMEEAQDVYELGLITDACRKRIHQQHPNLEETAVNEMMMWSPLPPILLVVSALAQLMHVPEIEHKEQVATAMALRVCP